MRDYNMDSVSPVGKKFRQKNRNTHSHRENKVKKKKI